MYATAAVQPTSSPSGSFEFGFFLFFLKETKRKEKKRKENKRKEKKRKERQGKERQGKGNRGKGKGKGKGKGQTSDMGKTHILVHRQKGTADGILVI